jgi:hypothetical protein
MTPRELVMTICEQDFAGALYVSEDEAVAMVQAAIDGARKDAIIDVLRVVIDQVERFKAASRDDGANQDDYERNDNYATGAGCCEGAVRALLENPNLRPKP